MRPALQFGAPDAGRDHRDRPSVFGLLIEDGLLACVKVTREGGFYFDLPGGAVDGDETEAQALIREFLEETGLEVRPLSRTGEAGQYFVRSTGEGLNNLSGFWIVETTGLRPEAQVEADHEQVWMTPDEAIRRLRHDAHAWAVSALLRRG